jgi:hypothetical protein
MIIDHIPVFEGQAAGYYGPRKNHGVVWHRVVGTYRGTIQHFNLPDTGLTDYLIGSGSVDGAALDGTILQLNDPLGLRSGYASGRVIAPYGDGLAFVQDRGRVSPMGINAVNGEQISIELSGWYTTPLTPKQRAALIHLTAYYADQAGIPWDVFPIWPGHGYSFVRWHNEFTGLQEKECPGSVVMNETATLLDLVAQFMRKYQEGASVPIEPKPYAAPIMFEWMAADLASGVMKDHVASNGVRIWAGEREYVAIRDTPRRRHASLSSPERVGPDIKRGTRFRGTHQIEGGRDYILTPFGTRVLADDLTPRVRYTANAAA